MPALLYYLTPLTRSTGLLVALASCALSCIILLFTGRCLTLDQRRAAIGCLLWLVVPILFYSVANVKYRWYGYSCLIAVPALTAVLVGAAQDSVKEKKVSVILSCIVFALLALFAAQNIRQISEISFHHTIQDFLKQSLNREIDSGTHVYIQYNEGNRTDWMPADMLTSLYSGNVVCESGGIQGYLAADGDAVLFVCKENHLTEIETLQAQEGVRSENAYLIAFEK